MYICMDYDLRGSAHLVSTGVEEVAQADDVAVVQLPHDLQLTVLKRTKT